MCRWSFEFSYINKLNQFENFWRKKRYQNVQRTILYSDINLGSFIGLRQHLELVCCIAGWLESTLKPRNNGHFGGLILSTEKDESSMYLKIPRRCQCNSTSCTCSCPKCINGPCFGLDPPIHIIYVMVEGHKPLFLVEEANISYLIS